MIINPDAFLDNKGLSAGAPVPPAGQFKREPPRVAPGSSTSTTTFLKKFKLGEFCTSTSGPYVLNAVFSPVPPEALTTGFKGACDVNSFSSINLKYSIPLYDTGLLIQS